jgi:hypothetical protein
MRRLAPLALDQRPAAVGDALQHFAEEGGIHRVIPSGQSQLMVRYCNNKLVKAL